MVPGCHVASAFRRKCARARARGSACCESPIMARSPDSGDTVVPIVPRTCVAHDPHIHTGGVQRRGGLFPPWRGRWTRGRRGAGPFRPGVLQVSRRQRSRGLPMVANGPRPIDLTSPDWQRSRSDQDVAAVIRNGRGAMPPFADVLTAGQIDALGSYVRRLQRP